MFSLTIALRGNPISWTLLYHKEETARAAFKLISAGQFFEVGDDFGQEIFLPTNSHCAVLLEDLDKSALAHIERALHAARTNSKGQARMQQDPMLRASTLTRGPDVLQPMRNGRGY